MPIPANAVIEGDGPTGPAPPADRGDSHLLVYDRDANVLYELYQAVRPNETEFPYGGTKPAGAVGGVPDLVLGPEHQLLPDDRGDIGRRGRAADPDRAGPPGRGEPSAAGGVGVIDHAIRMTVQQTRDSSSSPPRTRRAVTPTATCRGWASGSG